MYAGIRTLKEEVTVIGTIATSHWLQHSGQADGRRKYGSSTNNDVQLVKHDEGHDRDDDVVFLGDNFEENRSKLVRPKAIWAKKRIVAFPINLGLHWSLGILVNQNFGKPLPPAWHLFHLDSLTSEREVPAKPRLFARFALGNLPERNLSAVQVPVPAQRARSLDCALYPGHFLKVFLEDRDWFISYCLGVSEHLVQALPLIFSQNLSQVRRDSEENKTLWKASTFNTLRPMARRYFKFYRELYRASMSNSDRHTIGIDYEL